MSEPGLQPVDILPNRLAAVEFEPIELETILGIREEERPLQTDSFNWVAAYLCEEVGLTELDLARWFRRDVAGLGNQSPLDVWQSEDGYGRVFQYAQKCKEYADKVMPDVKPNVAELPRSHQLAERALVVVSRAFEVADVSLEYGDEEDMLLPLTTIHNPAKPDALIVTFKGDENSEGYKIITKKGSIRSSYIIYRHLLDGEEFTILQTAIFTVDEESERSKEEQLFDSRSDLDDRPPSAGEIAAFVVPLAVEVKNGTLWPMHNTSL